MKRKKFTEAFKKEAVRKLELCGQRSGGDIAKELGISASQLYSWRKRYPDAVSSARDERGETLEEEVVRLRRELAYSRRQEEILKKAATYFAKESE